LEDVVDSRMALCCNNRANFSGFWIVLYVVVDVVSKDSTARDMLTSLLLRVTDTLCFCCWFVKPTSAAHTHTHTHTQSTVAFLHRTLVSVSVCCCLCHAVQCQACVMWHASRCSGLLRWQQNLCISQRLPIWLQLELLPDYFRRLSETLVADWNRNVDASDVYFKGPIFEKIIRWP